MPAISAAPTIWRPTFVGGSLGSGLNASLLRKLQILAYWLETIYPGTTFTYVQGSPSGSGASGGTHAGPGDAADLEISRNGKPAPTGVYVIASLILRLLGCIAWVRGQDVNGDGVKDDVFAAHLHVIDREGGQKVPAAAAQIMQYLAHQNGLIGGRTDYEVLVRDPLWLDMYTDDLFRTRFMALTPAAAAIESHTEPEDNMLTFMTVAGDPTGAVYLSDGITARHVTSTQPGVPAEQVLADLATLASEGLLRIVQPPASANTITVKGVVVRKVRSLDVIGTVVGAAAAPTTTVTAVLDPAALNAAFDAALANVAFTTRRAAL